MCEPISAGILSGIGTALSAYGAIKQGQAQSSAATYQAGVDKNNATIAGYNANIAEQSQEQKTQAIERAGSLRLGAQRAALGASGIDLGSGSAGNVLDATMQDTNRTAASSEYQGELTGYGYRTQQQNFLGDAAMATANGNNAATAGLISGGASVLGGAGQVASKWYAYQNRQGYVGAMGGMGGYY